MGQKHYYRRQIENCNLRRGMAAVARAYGLITHRLVSNSSLFLVYRLPKTFPPALIGLSFYVTTCFAFTFNGIVVSSHTLDYDPLLLMTLVSVRGDCI